MRINLYAQNRHTLILDGIPITGFADGDWMQVKVDGNAAARTQGGDGPAMNLSVPQGGAITLNLLPTSPAMGALYEIRKQQVLTPRLFGIVLVTGVEEVIQAAGCAFGDLAQFATGGPTMQGRTFNIEALQIKMDGSAVEAIAGALLP
jgi:hypothetical protein